MSLFVICVPWEVNFGNSVTKIVEKKSKRKRGEKWCDWREEREILRVSWLKHQPLGYTAIPSFVISNESKKYLFQMLIVVTISFLRFVAFKKIGCGCTIHYTLLLVLEAKIIYS